MTQEQLKSYSNYLYILLRHKPFCAKCGKIINKTDRVDHIRIKHFRGRVEHKFYHEDCIGG